jgi:hypothetical protein
MAVFNAILVPGKERGTKIAALAAITSSAEVLLGPNVIFAINATKDITIAFGATGMGAALATDGFRIPANSTFTFDMGRSLTAFRVFNLDGAATADVYYMPLSKF